MLHCITLFRPASYCRQLVACCLFGTLLPAWLQAADLSGLDNPADTSLSGALAGPAAPGFSSVVPVDTAFALNSFLDTKNNAMLVWEIQPEHYLYRDKLRITTLDGMEFPLAFPPAQSVTDEFFGESAVYFDRLILSVPLGESTDTSADSINLVLYFQGCAKDRYCYPPQQKLIRLELP
jgi:thiol:disulfide interchange protein DsbD